MSAIFTPSPAPASSSPTAATTTPTSGVATAAAKSSASSATLKKVLLSVGAEFAFVAFLVMLAGDYPEPVAAFVAVLWILFLINRAGGFNGLTGAAGGSTTSSGSNLAPGFFLSD